MSQQEIASVEGLDRWCAHFDHHAPELTAEIVYDVYAQLRERPIAWSDRHGGFWVLTRHEDVMAAAADHETFSSAEGAHVPRQPGQMLFVPLDFDPPLHTAYRKVFADALTPARVRETEPQIRALAAELVDDFVAAGGGDFVQAVAVHLPIRLISEMLGLSEEVSARIRSLTERIWEGFGQDGRTKTALDDLIDLLFAEALERRADPREDLLTELVTADIDGRPFTDAELRSTLATFAIAGHETTMNASANLMYELALHPELQEQVRDDVPGLRRVIEESLRLRAPAHIFARTVTRDTELNGQQMRRGDKVLLVFASANRDDAKCPHADAFDPGRAMAGSLAFGWGLHRCVGVHLARAELRILAQEMLAHSPFAIAGEVRFSDMEGGHHMGVRVLPLRFD